MLFTAWVRKEDNHVKHPEQSTRIADCELIPNIFLAQIIFEALLMYRLKLLIKLLLCTVIFNGCKIYRSDLFLVIFLCSAFSLPRRKKKRKIPHFHCKLQTSCSTSENCASSSLYLAVNTHLISL